MVRSAGEAPDVSGEQCGVSGGAMDGSRQGARLKTTKGPREEFRLLVFSFHLAASSGRDRFASRCDSWEEDPALAVAGRAFAAHCQACGRHH